MHDSGDARDIGQVDSGADGGHARIPHMPALDGLRGAAVAGVLLFHGEHLTGGFLGVDAFFVLSGFLITSLLLVEAHAGHGIALGAFWARRARRLLPALGLVLVAVALYAALLAKPDELATIRGDALATIGYFANWRAIAANRDYWALFRTPSPLSHTWSLAIEEQFYLVWPLLVAAIAFPRRNRARDNARPADTALWVLVVSVLFALASLAWTFVIFDPANPSRIYYGTDTRIASILIGTALAAWLAIHGPVKTRRGRAALEIAALACIVVLGFAWTHLSGSSNTLYRGGLFACALATAVVIAAATHPRPGRVSQLLSFRPLCWLGLISYGVYLWHWPIYVVLDPARTHIDGWPLVGVRVATTLAVAVVSYRFVEQPVRHGAGTWTRSRRWTVAFASAVAVVVAVMVTTTSGPAPHVVVADQIRQSTPRPKLHPGQKGAIVGVQRVLVVGNSIALYSADEGFKQLHTVPSLDVLNLGSIGCRLLPEESRTRYPNGDTYVGQSTVCRNNWAYAVSVFRPDVVVLLVSEPTDAAHEINGQWTAPCEPAYDQVLESELHDQVRILASQGARVIVSTAAYTELPFKSPAWFQHNDCQNAIFRRVAASEPRAVLADIFDWICPRVDMDCDTHLAGVVLRPDGVHYRDESARLLAAWLITQAQHHGVFTGVKIEGPEAHDIRVPPTP